MGNDVTNEGDEIGKIPSGRNTDASVPDKPPC